MSELKNHYGENVGWFCYEASLIDADFEHSDLLPDTFEIICDNGGSIDVDVKTLFESAHVVIEEKDTHINKLQHDNDRLREALKESLSELKNYEITTDKMSFTKSRKKYLKLLKVD
ncbi:hypothetical protein ACYUFO_002209 [Vibrio parahaemolyticus]